MQIGYNNDVKYREKTFHIQTEDRGEKSASIETQIFHSGAILDTSILSYEKVLKATEDFDERIEKIRHLMQVNHKKLYKRLFKGAYDEMVGLEKVEDVVVAEPDFVPSQEAVPAAALEIERGNITSLGEPEGVESMDLAALQAQLNADAAAAEGVASSEAPPTMMLRPADLAATQETAAVPTKVAVSTADYPATGATSWRGCEPIEGDVDIIKLVEAFAS